MRNVRTVLLAGVAAISVVAFSGLAAAKNLAAHTLTIQLPDGGTEQIQYIGSVAPKISIIPGSLPIAALAPIQPFFWPDPTFARLEQISSAMDRRMISMLSRIQDLSLRPDGSLNKAALEDLPSGASSYSVVSVLGGNGFCAHSIQITPSTSGGRPRVVSQSSGNCKASSSFASPAVLPTSPYPLGQLLSASAQSDQSAMSSRTLQSATWQSD